MIQDSVHFSIYAKIVELATKWGISPGNFHAEVSRPLPDERSTRIQYISYDQEISDKFARMLSSLNFGAPGEAALNAEFCGTPKEIIAKLDEAILKAPSTRMR